MRVYRVPCFRHDGLGSDYPPAALLSVCSHLEGEQPAAHLLVQDFSIFGLFTANEVYHRFTYVNPAIEPCPRSALMLADPNVASRFHSGFRRGTLFRQLHTPPLPVAHVPIGYC